MSTAEFEAWGVWVTIMITLGIAIVGWSKARAADRHADEAMTLARSAEARADRIETRQYERRDVAWEIYDDDEYDEGHEAFTITNVGSDIAFDVELFVDPITLDLPRRSVTAVQVDPTEVINLSTADLEAAAAAQFDSAMPGMLLSPGYTFRARVTWRSEAGVPSVFEWEAIHR